MTSPIPLAWDDEPDAADYLFYGLLVLAGPALVTLISTGWVIRLPWRLARAVRRHRRRV